MTSDLAVDASKDNPSKQRIWAAVTAVPAATLGSKENDPRCDSQEQAVAREAVSLNGATTLDHLRRLNLKDDACVRVVTVEAKFRNPIAANSREGTLAVKLFGRKTGDWLEQLHREGAFSRVCCNRLGS